MAIRIDSFCYECLLRRHVATARSLGTEEQATEFARRLLRACLDAPEETPSPVIGTVVSDLLLELYGVPLDRFHREKEESNRFVLERMEDIRRKVIGAEDPVFAGLQMAILGNYLDYGALQDQVSFEKLDEMMDDALQMELDRAVYDRFCADWYFVGFGSSNRNVGFACFEHGLYRIGSWRAVDYGALCRNVYLPVGFACRLEY